MSIRKVSFAIDEYYHVYNRGNSKQKIFNDKEDYTRFSALLYACNQKENFKSDGISKGEYLYDIDKQSSLVDIGAYVLMPNHFHLLLTQKNLKEDDGISKFMQKLSTAYVMYYNKKYKRAGGLFEGKFKSQHLGTDKYLKYMFSYIHLNPIKLIDKDWKENSVKNKKEFIKYLKSYTCSSFLDYLGIERTQNIILNTKSFPKYFPNGQHLMREIFDWLDYKEPLY